MKRKLLGLPEFETHWHPCCQKTPEEIIQNAKVGSTSDYDRKLKTYRCPRGHEYEAPEPFILTTPDLACNSGPLCVYCYVTWLHVNIGTEEHS
jgi:hypothetical protein